MAAKPKSRKPQTPAKSIDEYVKSAQGDGLIEIEIPLDLLSKIARACANHDVGAGIAFTTAASSRIDDRRKEKPVPADVMEEAVANAQEELKGME